MEIKSSKVLKSFSEEAKVISNIAVILVNHDQFKALEHSYWAGLKVIDISGLNY